MSFTEIDNARLQRALKGETASEPKKSNSLFGFVEIKKPQNVANLCSYCEISKAKIEHPLREYIPFGNIADLREMVRRRFCKNCAMFLGYEGSRRARYFLTLSKQQQKFLSKKWSDIDKNAQVFRAKIQKKKTKK